MPQPVLVLWIARGMALNAQTGLSISKRANGKLPVLLTQIFLNSSQRSSYANMDFALLSTLLPALSSGISRVLVSYDIGCQWIKNLQSRVSQYSMSASLDLNTLQYWKVVVPKFHLSGHGESCQTIYNLNYTKGAGRTDGERIEGGWSQSGSMAVWTRENGPYARRAVLDDHWGSLNWQKLLGLRKFPLYPAAPSLTSFLGAFLLKNLRRSVAWSKTQRSFALAISAKHPTHVLQQWKKMREDFDRDPAKPNPYEEPRVRKSFAVRSTQS